MGLWIYGFRVYRAYGGYRGLGSREPGLDPLIFPPKPGPACPCPAQYPLLKDCLESQ